MSRLESKLDHLAHQAKIGKLRDKDKVERRIGRLLEQNSRAASLFNVTVIENGTGKDLRLCLHVKKNEERQQWALQTGGSYILRTNWSECDPKTLWKTYIQLTETEDAFRTEKHDLGMRPIFHQKQDGGYPLKRSQSIASENKDSATQQTEKYRKCSEENCLNFIVTN